MPLCGGNVDELGDLRLCFASFPPHASLCAAGVWKSCCFPLLDGRHGAGHGLNLVRHLLRGMQRGRRAVRDEDGRIDSMNPSVLQSLADLLRNVSHQLPEQSGEIERHVQWLQDVRDSMVQQSHMRGERAYTMLHLINCMTLACLARDQHQLKRVLKAALTAAVRQEEVRKYYLSLIDQPRQILAPPTMYRHRLTLHLGYCRMVAEMTEEMMGLLGSVTSWGTLDSSTQGNYDLVYHGATRVPTKDLTSLFLDAVNLIQQAHINPEEQDVENMMSSVERLVGALSLTAGVPAGVGCGSGSMRDKMHALSHATRLMSPSWASTAQLITTTFTWTGDLGVESKIGAFKESLRSLQGDWVVQADHPRGDDEGFEVDIQGVVAGDAGDDDQGALDVEVPAPAIAEGNDVWEGPFDFEVPGVAEEHGDEETPAGGDLEAEPVAQDDFPMPEDPYEINCSYSLYILGMLHIVSNITKDMELALAWFHIFLKYLTNICRLLSRKWTRQRFRATCLRSPAAAAFHSMFDGFNAHVQTNRWGSVVQVAAALLQLMEPLRRFWSMAAYTAAGRHRADDEGDGTYAVKVEVVNAGISSSLFLGVLCNDRHSW